MIVPTELRCKFDSTRPALGAVQTRVRDAVLGFCEGNGFAFLGRPKTLESLAEKVETGRFKSWDAIDDLYAATIVVPTLNQEPAAIAFLQAAFRQIALKPRASTQKAPELFRFDTPRFVGVLASPDFNDADAVQFEVQVRTAFEHAWSVSTHDFAYKSSHTDWARFRVAAQLRALVEQADTFILGLEDNSARITSSPWSELDDQKQVLEAFGRLAATSLIPCEHIPLSWSRFAKSFQALKSSAKALKRLSNAQIFQVLEQSAATQPPPLSVSLLQWTMGVFAEEGLLQNELSGYTPFITSQLEDFYPATKRLSARFRMT